MSRIEKDAQIVVLPKYAAFLFWLRMCNVANSLSATGPTNCSNSVLNGGARTHGKVPRSRANPSRNFLRLVVRRGVSVPEARWRVDPRGGLLQVCSAMPSPIFIRRSKMAGMVLVCRRRCAAKGSVKVSLSLLTNTTTMGGLIWRVGIE